MKHVLIIEDEKPIQRVLLETFEDAGFKTSSANRAEPGLSLALQEHPDLILLDIVMPGMDGLEMLKKLREDAWGKAVPVILLTNFGDTEKIVEATKNGAYGYLVKANWEPSEVVKKVKEALHLS